MVKKRLRHPPKKNTPTPTQTPPLISCGNKEEKFLRYVKENKIINVKAFARLYNFKRSSVYDGINKLIDKGLLSKPMIGMYEITTLGEKYLNNKIRGVETLRQGCRKGEASTHFSNFTLKIKNKDKFENFTESKINSLGGKLIEPNQRFKKVQLRNLCIYYIYFDDLTLLIRPKSVRVKIHDVVSQNHEENLLTIIEKTLPIIDKLTLIGIETDTLKLDDVHFADVNTDFAEIISKIDDKFYLDLDDGKKLWIDFSNGEKEEESNDLDTKKRLKEFITDAIHSENNISDMDKIKEVLSLMVKLRMMEEKTILDKPFYLG